MSTGGPFPSVQARQWAARLVRGLLEPTAAVRAQVAGSLRRGKSEVSDIEIVLEPRSIATDLLGTTGPDVETIRQIASTWGHLVKSGDRYIQVRDAIGIAGLTVDVFLVHPPAEWGTILAIRTGPAKLSQHAVTCMYRYGRRCTGGHVLDVHTGQVYPTPDEAAFFLAAGLRCLPPEQRDGRRAFAGESERSVRNTQAGA